MQLFCLGLSHHTAAVSLRECFAVPESETPAVLSVLREAAGLAEAVLLSTCNRVEIYGAARDAETAMAASAAFLRERAGEDAPFYRMEGGTCSAWPRRWIPWCSGRRKSSGR